MDSTYNPYSPGSGRRPLALAGRQSEQAAFDAVVERTRVGLDARGLMLTGLRGVGKTVLLNDLRARAERADWMVVSVEGRVDAAGEAGLRRTLGREISAAARRLGRSWMSEKVKRALETVTAFNVKVGASGVELGVQRTDGRADSGDVEVDLAELVEDLTDALAEHGTAFGLFIDEMQDLDPGLTTAVLATQHRAAQRGWPFYVTGAGLPHLPRWLAEQRSYAERMFDYRAIGRLQDPDAQDALTEPARLRAVEFEADALGELLAAADGYPYFLQEFGSAAWEVSAGSPVTQPEARDAVALGLQRLDDGFFRTRWDRATASERRMLIAMADDRDKPSSSSEVARRMGLAPTSLGPYRAKLIQKGLIWAPGHGQIAYSVPGMASFVVRHREEVEGPR